MKIQYFVKTKGTQPEDYAIADKLRKQGNKVTFGNGDFTKGFQTTCDAVYLSADFPHIEAWAVSKGIKVMKLDPVVAEPKQEVKTNAETLHYTEGQEEKTEEEVKPRRGRRKAVDSGSDSE